MEDLIGRMGGNQMDYSVEESGFIHSTKSIQEASPTLRILEVCGMFN